MIAVRPGTEAHRALELLVDRPGQLDAAAVGQLLYCPRVTGTHDYLAVRAAMLAHGVRPARVPRAPWRRPPPPPVPRGVAWSTRASTLIHGLQTRGLVERVRPPMVAESWIEQATEDAAEAVRLAAVEAADLFDADPTGLRAALLAELVRRTPATVADWVGAVPSGHIQRAAADLVEWGIVVPPSHRWPTQAGIVHVERARGDA